MPDDGRQDGDKEAAEPGDPLVLFARAQPALTVAGITAAVFVVKVMFVARLNTEVALGIVAATGPAELVFGLIALLFPAFALYLSFVLGLVALTIFRRGGEVAVVGTVSVVAFLIGLATSPVSWILVFIIAVVLGELGGRGVDLLFERLRLGKPAALKPDERARAIGILSAVFALAVLIQPEMWLPPENFRVPEQRADMVGYFIEEDGEWLTVLDETSHRLIRFRESEISDRRLCTFRFDEPLSTPLWTLLNPGQGQLEGCFAASSATGGPLPAPSVAP
jgi:hypothetical protein